MWCLSSPSFVQYASSQFAYPNRGGYSQAPRGQNMYGVDFQGGSMYGHGKEEDEAIIFLIFFLAFALFYFSSSML